MIAIDDRVGLLRTCSPAACTQSDKGKPLIELTPTATSVLDRIRPLKFKRIVNMDTALSFCSSAAAKY